MRIAYCEDNMTNLALVQRVALIGQHEIVNYTEGEVALRELSHQRFDLILMDIELAGEMNGLDVVRGLRARGLTTPIVAVTAYAMMGDREKCLEAGCNDYLPKPLPIADFMALLAHTEVEISAKRSTPPVAEPSVAALPVAAPLTPTPVATVATPVPVTESASSNTVSVQAAAPVMASSGSAAQSIEEPPAAVKPASD